MCAPASTGGCNQRHTHTDKRRAQRENNSRGSLSETYKLAILAGGADSLSLSFSVYLCPGEPREGGGCLLALSLQESAPLQPPQTELFLGQIAAAAGDDPKHRFQPPPHLCRLCYLIYVSSLIDFPLYDDKEFEGWKCLKKKHKV
jgi:hypothetical protein